MTALIEFPIPLFYDLEGDPLESGYVYIGQENENPTLLSKQIVVYWDEAGTIPADQPIRTISGYPVRNGSPSRFFSSAITYSIAVYTKRRRLIVYEPSTQDIAQALRDNLANETDVDLGSAMVGHYDPLSPAYLKTVSDIINGSRVSFLRFVPRAKHAGIFAKSNTDDLQVNLQTACNAGSYQLGFTRGLINIGSAVDVPNPMAFYGEGPGELSVIAGNSATQNMFNITAEGNGKAVSFRDLAISTTVTKTAGVAISYLPAVATQNDQSTIDSVYFNGQFTAVDFQKAAYWTLKNSHFLNNAANGQIIKARNTTTPDSGDATFENNWFYGGSGCTGLRYESGGALRVRGNKFLQLAVGIDATFASGATTGILIASGNSFDGMTAQSFSLTTADATANFTDINIGGNIFNGSPSVSHLYLAPVIGATIGRANVTGNNFLRNTGITPVIQLVGGSNWAIIGNTINGPAVVGISIGVLVTNSLVAMNQMESMSISNSSPTTLVIDSRSGSVPIMNIQGFLGIGTASVGATVTNCIALANTSAPTTSPAAVGQIYVEAGSLKYRGAAGTVTTIAAS